MNEERLAPEEVRRLERHAAALHAPAAWVTWAAAGCIAVGAVGFLVGLRMAPGRAWGAFLANFMFWTALCMGGVVVGATFNVSHATWGRAIQRMVSGLGSFLPASVGALIALWFGRGQLYAWTGTADHSAWLSAPWLFGRDIAILLVSTALVGWVHYRAMRPDVGVLVEEGRLKRSRFYAFLLRGWVGRADEQIETMRLLRTLSPAIICWYALGFAILSIDLEMSLTPEFRSTMYPVLYWIGGFYAAFGAAAVLVAMWSRVGLLADVFSAQQVMDLGNMLWGCSIFWAYITWSQYFVFWMGNLPSEAGWHVARWRVWPWDAVAWTMLACAFLVPFFVLFARGIKRNPIALAVIGGIVMLGVLLQQFLFVLPAVPNLGASDFGLVEVAVTVGFMGAVAFPYLWLMRRVPLFPIEDPLFVRALETRGVEA